MTTKKKTTIISAFPACGKSYITNAPEFQHLTCADSDSSAFSWVYPLKLGLGGGFIKERNPDFPSNYLAHIKELAATGTYDYIFVSSHAQVRSAMEREGIEFSIVFPNRNCLEEWVERCRKRGNDEAFIETLRKNWDDWIDDMEASMGGHLSHILQSGEYLDACLEELRW